MLKFLIFTGVVRNSWEHAEVYVEFIFFFLTRAGAKYFAFVYAKFITTL